ncbi:MAG: helix-turn-helix domain-containing protein [Ruminiclostridium sp.]
MSKSMKGIATTDKVKLVERYLKGELSLTAAAKDIGVDKKAVSLWVQLYKIGGPTVLLPQKKNQHYSKELKFKAVTGYLNGNDSLNVICEKYHMPSSFQLRQWIKLYSNHETFKS